MALKTAKLKKLKEADLKDAIRRVTSLKAYLQDVIKKVEEIKIKELKEKIKKL